MSDQPQTQAKMSEEILQKALAEIEFPLSYDKNGQFIIDAGENIILEVRGWSKYQHFEDPDNIQDAFGEHVVKVLNEQSRPSVSIETVNDIILKSKEKIDALESQLSLYKRKVELMETVINQYEAVKKSGSKSSEISLENKIQAISAFNAEHPEIK